MMNRFSSMKILLTTLLLLAVAQFAPAQESTVAAAAPAVAATAPAVAAASPAEVGGSVGATGDDFLPEAFRPDRHASTWMNSPFSREVLPPAAGPSGPTGPAVWDGWKIAAVDKFGGQYSVGLVSKKGEFFLLKVGQEHEETEVKVTKVESNGVISETVIHVTDGSQSGTITFDTKRLTTASKGGAAPKAPTNRAPARPTTGRPQLTPQQVAAQQAAKKRAAAQLHTHLQQSANAQLLKQRQNAAAGNAPTTGNTNRVKRRAVVLPPSTR